MMLLIRMNGTMKALSNLPKAFNRLIVLMFSCIIVSLNLAAQQSLADTIEIEEIVVTGTLVKVHRNNIPMAVSVMRREQIEETDASAILPALSGRVPGLFVTERGITGFGVATGSAGQITIRGIGGNPTTGVLILIDGHPQFMGIMGHPLPDSYVASDVERVEVIRGPASMLYGTNAMGGVINIITRKQNRPGFHGHARFMYGSYNTQKYMAAAGYKKRRLTVFASVNHDKTDGHRKNSDFRISNGYVKIGYTVSDHLILTSDFSIANFNATDPGPDTANAQPGNTIDITRGYGALTIDNDFQNYSGTARLFYNFGEHQISDGFHSNDINFGINLFESLKLFDNNSITAGFDFINYGGMAENIRAMGGEGIIFTDTAVHETGIYGFIQHTLFSKLTLNAGIRYQNHRVFGNNWIPSGGLAYRMSDRTTWKASVSKGYRSPSIRELFITQWGADPDLKPDQILSYEAGFHHIFKPMNLTIELTAFMVKGENIIVAVPLQGLRNSGHIENKGIEFSANAQPANNLRLSAAYSYINMKESVYATPEHQLFISGRYHYKRFSIIPRLQIVRNIDTDPGPESILQNYVSLNLKTTCDLAGFAEIFASCENALNQTYEINRYYPMPGITFISGINLRY